MTGTNIKANKMKKLNNDENCALNHVDKILTDLGSCWRILGRRVTVLDVWRTSVHSDYSYQPAPFQPSIIFSRWDLEGTTLPSSGGRHNSGLTLSCRTWSWKNVSWSFSPHSATCATWGWSQLLQKDRAEWQDGGTGSQWWPLSF